MTSVLGHAERPIRTRTAATMSIIVAAVICSSVAGAEPPPTAPSPPAAPATGPAVAPASTPAVSDDELSEMTVTLKSGRSFTGLLLSQTAEAITIRVGNIPMRIAMEDVSKTSTNPPFMERYRQLREAVGDDPDQIVRLAQWLQSLERYPLALSETNRAISLDKQHPTARRLKTLLEEQIRLQFQAQQDRKPKEPEAEDDNADKPVRPIQDFPLVSADEINTLKVFEINLAENPRLVIPRMTVQRLLEKFRDHPLVPLSREGREIIERQPPLETLDLMFRLQAREFYHEVQVLDQPSTFVTFRDQISRAWLINSCSTNNCHGGMEAGRFILHNRRPNSDPTVYTNFLILMRYRLNDGKPLIDLERPERSPLLQMGLPRKDAFREHPEVLMGVAQRDAWRPAFRSSEDHQFKVAVQWIKDLYRPRPEYPFTYKAIRPLSLTPAPGNPAAPRQTGPSSPAPSNRGPTGTAPASPASPAGQSPEKGKPSPEAVAPAPPPPR